MVRKSSLWLVVFISVMGIAFIAAGCAKKQVVKEETAAKPILEAKPAPPPSPPPAPKVVEQPEPAPAEPAPAPAPVAPPPRIEAKPEAAPKAEAKPGSLDLDGMRLQFAFDDYTLSSRSKENLEKIASWMNKDPNVKMQIQGNTCDIGTAEYNLALGDRRANSATRYLETLGVDSTRLSTISYGEEKPRVPNTDEANRSQNRRDEFVMAK